MKPKSQKSARVLLIDSFTPDARGEVDLVVATVACVGESGSHPLNWSFPYADQRFTGDCGGCSARLYRGSELFFLQNGPKISHCDDPEQYLYAAKALQFISRKLTDIYRQRGNTQDSIESLSRWIEVTGCKAVYMRPQSGSSSQWLTQGEWMILTPGEFIFKLRRAMVKEPSALESMQAISDAQALSA